MAASPAHRVRIGMIGGGEGAFIGEVHRLAAALDGAVELVCGSFSRTADNNQRTGARLGLAAERIHVDWQTLLEDERQRPSEERMEAVVIVTPNHLHVPIAIAALRAGFHVLSEKPAALSLAQARDLEQAIESSQRLYGLAHIYLCYPLVWQAREMVREGRLGALRKIHVTYSQGWLGDGAATEGNKQAAWRTDPALAGVSGCMADIGTHAFGLAEFISGHTVNALCAALGTHVEGRRLDDDGDVLLRTAEGATGVLTASQISTGEENSLEIRIHGELGALEWRQMEPNSLIHRELNAPLRVLRAGIDQPGLCAEAKRRSRLPGGHPEGYLEALANLYRDFAAAVRRGDSGTAEGVPGILQGLRGMAFIEAVIASQKSELNWTPLAADSQA